MMQRRTFLSFAALALVAAGCGPQVINGASAPTLSVDATFLSASLSDDCHTTSSAVAAGDCRAAAGLYADSCGFCRQTNMQIRFEASAGTDAAHVDVVSVRLVDATTGQLLDTLTAREPGAWDAATSAYRPWDASIAPASTVRASWKLSAPDWTRVASATTRLAYTRPLRLEVVLRVDGFERTLRSGELTREPEVVT